MRFFFHNKNIIVGIVEILFNVFGLGYLLKVQLLNGTWWYMSIAVLFICSVPILYSLIKKYGYIVTALVLITVPRILQIPFSSNMYELLHSMHINSSLIISHLTHPF